VDKELACAICGGKPAIKVSYLDSYLCKEHFLEYFERRVLSTIKYFNLIEEGDVVAAAVSGGKDSLSLLYVLKKFSEDLGYTVFGIAVDEGIQGYREYKLKALKKVAEKIGVKIFVASFSENYGLTLDEAVKIAMRKGFEYKPCSICGVFRRYLLNLAAKELRANKLATGHNLDDETQVFLMNVLRGGVPNITREYPISRGEHEKLVTRIKPFYFIPEKETLTYALLRGLETPFVECPYVEYSIRHGIRHWLNSREREQPGTKYKVAASSLLYGEIFTKTDKSLTSLQTCKYCGAPSTSEICRACAFRIYLGLTPGTIKLKIHEI